MRLLRCGLHHRHDAGADRLGQVGPGGHDGGQVVSSIAGVMTPSHFPRRRVENHAFVLMGRTAEPQRRAV